jgi:hypothetical protein
VEDQTVLPHDNGRHEAAHAEDIVSLVPAQPVRVHPSLQDNTQVHEVTEVQHEQLVLVGAVVDVPAMSACYQIVKDVLCYLYDRRRVISPK